MNEMSGWMTPKATPDAGGAQTSFYSNPYASSTAQTMNAVPQMQEQGQDRLTQMYGRLNSFGGNSTGSQYPAMQNAYGLGGQMEQPPQAVPGTASNPNYMEQDLTTTMPDSGSRGFNPWSLTGEANARGN